MRIVNNKKLIKELKKNKYQNINREIEVALEAVNIEKKENDVNLSNLIKEEKSIGKEITKLEEAFAK